MVLQTGARAARHRVRSAVGGGAVPDVVDLAAITRTALAIHANRRIVKDYAGNVFQAKRYSDNAVLDAAPISASEHNVDWAALDTWGGGTGAWGIALRYDQSGNGRHETAHTVWPRVDTSQPAANGCHPASFAAFAAPSADANNHAIKLPAGLTLARESHWRLHVAELFGGGATSGTGAYLDTVGSGNNRTSIRYGTGSQTAGWEVACVMPAGATITALSGLAPRAERQIIGVSTNGTGNPTTFYLDDATATGANPNIGGPSGGWIGNDGGTPAAFLNGNLYASFYFNGPPTAGDIAYLHPILNQAFEITPTASAVVTWFGSSTTAEYRKRRAGLPSRTSRVMTKPHHLRTAGVAGTTLAQMVTGKAYLSAKKTTGAFNLAVISQVRNDINSATGAGITGAGLTAYNNTLSFVQQLNTDGWDKVLMLTPFSALWTNQATEGTAKQAELDDYQARILAGANAGGLNEYSVWDMKAQAAVADYTDTTRFDTDQIHTIAFAQEELAAGLGPVIDALLP